ncbi:SCP2 sterol-binding domain-containing protein, partial [Infirmifilum sp.]|uniref:SCP2 sterol-binding domain-containing protein n=1 Tax=Infirmifilum sp. TaxID=2856575 RepID=UPI003D0A8597
KFLKAVKGWNSRILVDIRPPVPGTPYSYRVLMEITDGKCTTLRVLEPEEQVPADIQVTMDLTTYEAMLRGELSSTSATLRGKVKISGEKLELMKRRESLEALTEAMREMLFRGGAIRVLLPYLRRDFTF